jgi:thiamine monophosphate synthase
MTLTVSKKLNTKLNMLCETLNQDQNSILENAIDFWAKQQITKNLEKFIQDFKMVCNQKDLPFDVDIFSKLVNEFIIDGLHIWQSIDAKSYDIEPFYTEYVVRLKEKYCR